MVKVAQAMQVGLSGRYVRDAYNKISWTLATTPCYDSLQDTKQKSNRLCKFSVFISILFSHLFDATKRIDIQVSSKVEANAISSIDLISRHAILVEDSTIGHRVHGDTAAQAGVHCAAPVVAGVAAGAASV